MDYNIMNKKTVHRKQVNRKTHNRKTHKNKLYTYAVVQYDNRHLNKHKRALQQINKYYCKLHGYEYIFISKTYDIPLYWVKVKIVKDLLHTNKYKGILWLDTDAVIHDFYSSLASICLPNHSFYYSNELVLNGTADNNTYRFNAGVWFILNTVQGKDIIDDWFKLYDSVKWYKQSDKWKTDGKWAGDNYEQGAFETNMINNQKYSKYIYQYPWFFFQSTDLQTHLGTERIFAFHFYGLNYGPVTYKLLLKYLKWRKCQI